MTQTLYEGFTHENLLSLLTTVENLPFDGRAFVKEVRGLRAHYLARGGYIEASTIHSEVMELPRDTVGFHVYEFEDKMETNFAESTSTILDLAGQRLDATINQRILALFEAAIPIGHDSYDAVSGLTLADLNLNLRAVRDTSRSREVAIVGRASMTERIVDQIMGASSNGAGFLPETNERLLNTGVIGNYRGAKIISLVNYLDEDDLPYFPGNELYVLGNDASKFAFWGGMKFKEWVENDAWYWHYMARRDLGGVVHRPDRARRIVDSQVDA